MEELPKSELLFGKYKVDKDGYVEFGDVVRGELGMQSQYASRYISGLDRPRLAEDLRVKGDPSNYHFLKIHKDDASEFIKRVKQERGE